MPGKFAAVFIVDGVSRARTDRGGWSADGLVEDGFGFDFDGPPGVEELGDDHGGSGADGGENFAVGPADFFPVFGAGEEDAGADDVGEGGTGGDEGLFDDGQDGASLGGRGEVFGADRACPGDVDDVADPHGPGEADDGFVGAGTGDVLAGGHGGRISRAAGVVPAGSARFPYGAGWSA